MIPTTDVTQAFDAATFKREFAREVVETVQARRDLSATDLEIVERVANEAAENAAKRFERPNARAIREQTEV